MSKDTSAFTPRSDPILPTSSDISKEITQHILEASKKKWVYRFDSMLPSWSQITPYITTGEAQTQAQKQEQSMGPHKYIKLLEMAIPTLRFPFVCRLDRMFLDPMFVDDSPSGIIISNEIRSALLPIINSIPHEEIFHRITGTHLIIERAMSPRGDGCWIVYHDNCNHYDRMDILLLEQLNGTSSTHCAMVTCPIYGAVNSSSSKSQLDTALISTKARYLWLQTNALL